MFRLDAALRCKLLKSCLCEKILESRSAVCLYSVGVASHSPGLPRIAATLDYGVVNGFYPEGVASFVDRH